MVVVVKGRGGGQEESDGKQAEAARSARTERDGHIKQRLAAGVLDLELDLEQRAEALDLRCEPHRGLARVRHRACQQTPQEEDEAKPAGPPAETSARSRPQHAIAETEKRDLIRTPAQLRLVVRTGRCRP